MLPSLFFCTACPEHPGLPLDVHALSATVGKAASLSDSVPHPLTQVSHIR